MMLMEVLLSMGVSENTFKWIAEVVPSIQSLQIQF